MYSSCFQRGLFLLSTMPYCQKCNLKCRNLLIFLSKYLYLAFPGMFILDKRRCGHIRATKTLSYGKKQSYFVKLEKQSTYIEKMFKVHMHNAHDILFSMIWTVGSDTEFNVKSAWGKTFEKWLLFRFQMSEIFFKLSLIISIYKSGISSIKLFSNTIIHFLNISWIYLILSLL